MTAVGHSCRGGHLQRYAEGDAADGAVVDGDFLAGFGEGFKVADQGLLGVRNGILVILGPGVAPGKRGEVGEVPLLVSMKINNQGIGTGLLSHINQLYHNVRRLARQQWRSDKKAAPF